MLCVVSVLSLSVSGAAQSGVPAHVLQVDFDVARFYGDETQVYVELYYSMYERSITFKPSSGKYVAGVTMNVEISGGGDSVIQHSWSVPYVIDDTSRLTLNKTIVGREAFALTPGEYVLKITSIDIFDSTHINRYVLPLKVSQFTSESPVFSDIELCSSIQSTTNKEGMFYKNTLEVVPNPSKLYGYGVPVVFYYAEAYNLLKQQRRDDIVVRTVVSDGMQNEVYREQVKKPRVYDSSVEIGKVNTALLRAGTYLLTLSLLDTLENVLGSTSKKFFVYKLLVVEKDSSLAVALPLSPEFLIMNEEELDKEFDKARYITSQAERDQYKLLSGVDAKQKFLSDFWRRRDSDPLTSENEFRDEYHKRADIAEQEFKSGMRAGWKSDRGRIMIVYGKPDEIERFSSTAESNPYEIWRYNSLQSGVIFVFVDRNGFGDYTLVHSSHRDELHDENWFQEYAQKVH